MQFFNRLLLVAVVMFSSCLDMFTDTVVHISGDVYYVNLDGSNNPFLGRKVSRGYEPLIEGSINVVEGNQSLLLAKVPIKETIYLQDTMFYKINVDEKGTSVGTLSNEEYYDLLSSMSVDIRYTFDSK